MIHVGKKQITERIAIAQGTISVGKEAFQLIKNKALPKGDALALSEIVGIQGAKNVSLSIPLCHPLILDHIELKTELNESLFSINVYCKVIAHAKTGVEMEALAGVNSALLSIYDLTKMVNPDLQINDIKLLSKIGGKSGVWINPQGVPEWVLKMIPVEEKTLHEINCSIITLSDRASSGIYDDKSGVFIKEFLLKNRANIIHYNIT